MKKDVLETLKYNKGSFISGEELSNRLGVTRTAIWKHINQLKEEGYEIESVSRKGYRLMGEPDLLNQHALQLELKTKTIGRRIVHYDTIDSTNTVAKKIAAEGAEEGAVVIAEEQTGGRGRLGRQWVSPKGAGIWMSLVLRPSIEPAEAAKITQIAAAAVTLAIRRVTGCEAGIKWPNDIILHKKKVCGILTEMGAELNSVSYIVVGIGINANVDVALFPEEVKRIATSIKDCVGNNISRKEIVLHILKEFEDLYLDFIYTKSIKKSVEICKAYSVTLGNTVKIINRDQTIIAEAVDLTEEGELIIRNQEGQMEKIISGEVSVRGISDYV
ncbi:BirA family biotin operon repressor/biotin-[acetyl-CoA-carboxylase] ligase [Anaerosolibacter carboniphilus]|uniref:Bifunctional ligase/repressor BirA n=1 Tax=Anaerosolibacter carboniphilus TaxID=1417629 RepID=A0A841L9H0_9FIRM|nr:biotin--[acetyl-CoA-carboxylase] ligase [Anaerosolibacter carboniphilus]MBB6219009.1 BirA family biotin operon repressor/biotin-[acetyl-CoA-carboxylase] ligase [Anaerosolibacter carboniphilus]